MSNSRARMFLVAFLISSFTHAGCSSKACVGHVDKIYLNEEGIYVKLGDDMSNLDCTLYGGTYMTLRNSHPNRDVIYSTLLAAHVSKNDGISVRVSEGSSDCKISYITSSN